MLRIFNFLIPAIKKNIRKRAEWKISNVPWYRKLIRMLIMTTFCFLNIINFFIKSYKQEEGFRCRFYYKLWFFHVNKQKVVFGLHLEAESVQAPEQMVFQISVHWRWLCLLLSCTCITANWCNDYVIVESSFEFRVWSRSFHIAEED